MCQTPVSFPGKVAKFLFLRYTAFAGDPEKGLIFLPCELIEQNGTALLQTVLQTARLWQLPEAFCAWVENCNTFCNTLVDRIVTGFPEQEKEALWRKLGYRDELLTVGEPFALWAVQGVTRLPFADENTRFVPDLAPVRKQKVRLLNGAHTSGVPVAFLAGKTIVRESVQDSLTGAFFRQTVNEEILPALPDAEDFAQSVFERFANPYIDHALLAILLNSVSKWKVRVLPSVKDHLARTGTLPKRLVFSFAALLRLYTVAGRDENGFFGQRDDGTVYPLRDDESVLLAFAALCKEKDYASRIAADASLWGEDLSALPGFVPMAEKYLTALQKNAINAIQEVLA